tara:strand:+ start:445 stop:615 length:171 start_codon:yes stop_codon:yes gene_type:complete
MNVDVKGWMETEGRTRWVTKGIMKSGRKYTCHSFGIKPRKANAVKEMYTNGKWRTV